MISVTPKQVSRAVNVNKKTGAFELNKPCLHYFEIPTSLGLPGCDSPFVLVRDQCFLIDSLSSGTWYEMRQICQTFATDMAMIKSADLLGDLVEIIYALGKSNLSVRSSYKIFLSKGCSGVV